VTLLIWRTASPPVDDFVTTTVEQMDDDRDRQGRRPSSIQGCAKNMNRSALLAPTLPLGEVNAQRFVDRLIRPHQMISTEPDRRRAQSVQNLLKFC